MKRSVPTGAEQLIGALVPGPLTRPAPAVAPMPTLPPSRRLAADAVPMLDIARVDRSGRVSARALMRRMRWTAGHPVAFDMVGGILVVRSAVDGGHIVGSRGDLALPAAARTLVGITDGVVVVGYPSDDVLVIFPVAAVARLLHKFHLSAVAADVC